MRKLWFFVVLLLFTPVFAWEVFPDDDPGLRVVDRAYKPIYIEGRETHYYAVLSNGGRQSFLDIYKGLPWKKIHRWQVTFEGERVKVRPRAALEISHDEEQNKLFFYWNDYAGYAEGAVHQVLIQDLESGEFTTEWSD